MKVIHLFIYFLLICDFSPNVYSQILRKHTTHKLKDIELSQSLNEEFTAVTVSKNDRSRDLIPAKESERFKMKFIIEKDAIFFNLKAEKFRYGECINDPLYREKIIYWPGLKKGEIIFFEVVPDVSLPSKLTLFTYFPVMTSFKFMNCPENKCFKYKIFERPTGKYSDSGPLMLIYVDDKNNTVETLVNKYSKNNLIMSSSQKYQKLLKEIELYMLVHYTIEYGPNVTK